MDLRLVPAEGVLPSEAWGERALLKRVVDGGRLPEQVAHRHPQTWPVEGVKTQQNTSCCSNIHRSVVPALTSDNVLISVQ